jgi:hypothetical protein
MMPKPTGSKILSGMTAGIISAVITLLLAYVVAAAAIAFNTKDLFATLLAAVTVLPLMLLIVFALPDIIIGLVTGALLALVSRISGRRLGLFTGALIGLILAELVFSLAVPFIAPPKPSGDFVSIISNIYISGAYGAVIGALTGILFRRFTRGN